MKNMLSTTKIAIILLIVTVLLTGSYIYLLTCPIAYGMKYRNETVYEGQVFEGSLKYTADRKVISENTNFDEPVEMYYYYKDGYVFHLMATTDEGYEAEVAYINENFDASAATSFYASKINAFKQVAVGLDEDVTTYTCRSAIAFAIVGGVAALALTALTASSFALSKKAKRAQ